MVQSVSESGQNTIEISGTGLSATISRRGAQLMSLKTSAGEELLWQGDPAYWPDRAPILFPVIGPVVNGTIHHAGKAYPMPAHGFAQARDFNVRGHMRNRVFFELHADDATRAHYPFEFSLRVAFDLADGTLATTISVTNEDSEPLPADIGFHPGFNRPLTTRQAGRDFAITFAEPEPAPIRRGVDDPIFLTPDAHPTPVEGSVLVIQDDLFNDNAIVFDTISSHSLCYGPVAPANGPCLRIEYPDSPYLAVWTRPGAPFIAIEPWQGLPSPVGFEGPLLEKPGIAVLDPGETRQWQLNVTVIDTCEAE